MNFLDVLMVFLSANLNVPYQWGGNNALEGYDCSGFVMEYMHTFGIGPKRDSSAQMIYNYYLNHRSETVTNWSAPDGQFPVGTLIFFGRGFNKITHVGIMINSTQMAEAGGGNRGILTEEEAALQNAYVKIRPIKNRNDWVSYVLPKYPEDLNWCESSGFPCEQNY